MKLCPQKQNDLVCSFKGGPGVARTSKHTKNKADSPTTENTRSSEAGLR